MANNKHNGKELATAPKVDIDFLNIPSADELMDLAEIEQPLVDIRENLIGTPVVVLAAEKRDSAKYKKQSYLILDIQIIETGEVIKSSCSHWFMQEFVKRCEEKGKQPFPVALVFYIDGDSVKFKGVKQTQQELPV